MELVEPDYNRFNRAGSRFIRLNRQFPVFVHFYQFFVFLRKSDRVRHQSSVQLVGLAGPVQFLKPWITVYNIARKVLATIGLIDSSIFKIETK